ncbi:ATPase [Azospira restricta]|uniref:histidine kinase n=2 Tax=Azospira restricta TaxID=404405 RepID=A0A974SSV9_9RHOO|nr:ATPase [Azospira restricta]
MLFLGAITRKPIDAIVGDLKAGQAPRYRGIAEFEFMSDSIGDMMRALQEKNAAIARYRDHLEALVAERTAELSRANEALRETNRELETTHEQLLHSEKMASVGQLAAGVAHEINNPVGFVNSNMAVLAEYLQSLLQLIETYERHAVPRPDDAAAAGVIEATRHRIDIDYLKSDAAALLAESRDGLDRVKRIVQDLKEFSHVGGKDWQRADVHRTLDSTLNVVWNELKYKAQVVKDYGELPEIECLPSELSQVFMNMLVNAGHAIAGNGVITIRTGREGEQVWVEFADTGGGIAPEHLPKIFDPFFTTKPVGQGTGLGLSLSYGIVRKHNGRIEVDSEVGRGTCFRIWLPIDQPQAGAVAQ